MVTNGSLSSLIIASNVERAESLLSEQSKSWRISSVEAAGRRRNFHRVKTLVQAAESFEEMLSSSETAVAIISMMPLETNIVQRPMKSGQYKSKMGRGNFKKDNNEHI